MLSSRARGAVYPYELAPLLAGPGGTFVEHDLDEHGPAGAGGAAARAEHGRASSPASSARRPPRYPEGMTRVALFGDPTKALGTVAEPECARVDRRARPRRGARPPGRVVRAVLRRRASRWTAAPRTWTGSPGRCAGSSTFTQAGGEINVVVAGINVGAQPYWNAEATMLMHTKGILVMTPDSAMVLTGKHSLDYSGGVSAEDNFGIGGYDRVMGPNGQAQYWAPNLTAAGELLFAALRARLRRARGSAGRGRPTPTTRATGTCASFPHVHPASDFTTVGDIFSADRQPGAQEAVRHPHGHAGGHRPGPPGARAVGRHGRRRHRPSSTTRTSAATRSRCSASSRGRSRGAAASRPTAPTSGPPGTLFPRSSKKTARAINAASGNRPLVVLANLSGFDGSPESLRKLQLEYGAEIGRAIVNFDGPIVFCVVSRYHGGAFVVFSGVLNDNMEVLAVEGSYASVIGGAPAAAVVFTREVDKRTGADPRVRELEAAVGRGRRRRAGPAAGRARRPCAAAVRSEKLGEVAAEFEAIHDIERARQVGLGARHHPGRRAAARGSSPPSSGAWSAHRT